MKNPDNINIITIRVKTRREREAIMLATKETGIKTCSKAILQALEGYERMAVINHRLLDENKRLRQENATLRKCAVQTMAVAEELKKIEGLEKSQRGRGRKTPGSGKKEE